MRLTVIVVGLMGLAACAPTVPDSGAGSSAQFGTYTDANSYRATRDTELTGGAPLDAVGLTTQGGVVSTETVPSSTPPAAGATPTAGTGTAPAVRVTANNPQISDEQDFGAVSNRQTIESDAERLRVLRENRTEVRPTAVPTRAGVDSGPNIVAYALQTRHALGQKIYRRGPSSQSKFERNCAKYTSQDKAQEDFLTRGGPQRDRLGLDPDGDGFACRWDPRPFRAVQSG